MPNRTLGIVYACLLPLAGCDVQVTPAYRGEALLTISGSVEIVSERDRGPLVPALTFQSADDPLFYIIDVEVEGEFPSDFTLRVYEPPPEGTFFSDPNLDLPAVAYASIAAVTLDHPDTITRAFPGDSGWTCWIDGAGTEAGCEITESWCRDATRDECYKETRVCPAIDSRIEDCEILSASGDASLRQDQWAAFAGMSEEYIVIYLAEPLARDDPARLHLSLPELEAGYHLTRLRKMTEDEQIEISDSSRECRQEAETHALERYNEKHETEFSPEEYSEASWCVFDEECKPPEFKFEVDELVVPEMDELDCWQYDLWQLVESPEKERISMRISPDVNPSSIGNKSLASDAFETIYRKHAPSAFRRARRLLGSDADAYETVHDIFLSLLERPEQYSGNSSLSTFIYSAITHACLNRIRNRRTRLRLLRDRWLGRPSAALRQETPEALSILRSALEHMPVPLGEVAVYYYMDGLSHQEIARILGCSRRQVGNHVSRIAKWATKEELSSCRM